MCGLYQKLGRVEAARRAKYPRRPRRVALWGTFTQTQGASFTTENTEAPFGRHGRRPMEECASHVPSIFPPHNPRHAKLHIGIFRGDVLHFGRGTDASDSSTFRDPTDQVITTIRLEIAQSSHAAHYSIPQLLHHSYTTIGVRPPLHPLSIFLTALTSPCTYRSGRRTSFTPADANRDPITPRGGKNISDDTHVFIE